MLVWCEVWSYDPGSRGLARPMHHRRWKCVCLSSDYLICHGQTGQSVRVTLGKSWTALPDPHYRAPAVDPTTSLGSREFRVLMGLIFETSIDLISPP